MTVWNPYDIIRDEAGNILGFNGKDMDTIDLDYSAMNTDENGNPIEFLTGIYNGDSPIVYNGKTLNKGDYFEMFYYRPSFKRSD